MAVDNEADTAHSRCHANDSSERHALFYMRDSLYDFFFIGLSPISKQSGPDPDRS